MKNFIFKKYVNKNNCFLLEINNKIFNELLYYIFEFKSLKYIFIYNHLHNEDYFSNKIIKLNMAEIIIYKSKNVVVYKISKQFEARKFINSFLKHDDLAFHILFTKNEIADIKKYLIYLNFDDIGKLKLEKDNLFCITNYWDTTDFLIYGEHVNELLDYISNFNVSAL